MLYTLHTYVLYVRICRCTIWRYVHKGTLFPIATDWFSKETFPSTYCEDDHRQSILIYLCSGPDYIFNSYGALAWNYTLIQWVSNIFLGWTWWCCCASNAHNFLNPSLTLDLVSISLAVVGQPSPTTSRMWVAFRQQNLGQPVLWILILRPLNFKNSYQYWVCMYSDCGPCEILFTELKFECYNMKNDS